MTRLGMVGTLALAVMAPLAAAGLPAPRVMSRAELRESEAPAPSWPLPRHRDPCPRVTEALTAAETKRQRRRLRNLAAARAGGIRGN